MPWPQRTTPATFGKDDAETLAKNAALLLARAADVIGDPAMARACPSCVRFGTSYSGPVTIDLGVLLELWCEGSLVVHNDEGDVLHFFTGGAGLSGDHVVRGVDLRTGDIVVTYLPRGVSFRSEILVKIGTAVRSGVRPPCSAPLALDAVVEVLLGAR
jgi:hypothetical protein